MAENRRLYEVEKMALAPLRLVMGDFPVPDPDRQNKAAQKRQNIAPEMENTVKRLIAHLKNLK